MSNPFPENPNHNEPWTNPETGEKFQFHRHRGWIPRIGVRSAGDDMTGRLVLPDTRINGGLLSADPVRNLDEPSVDPIPADYYREIDTFGGFDVAYGQGKFVAVANFYINFGDHGLGSHPSQFKWVMYSYDGVNWTDTSTGLPDGYRGENPELLGANNIGAYNTCYNFGVINYIAEKDMWFATFDRQPSSKYYPSDYTSILYSHDGLTWLHGKHTAGTQIDIRARHVQYNEDLDLLFCHGQTGVILTSEDGINWTRKGSTGLSPNTGIVYGNGAFVAWRNGNTNMNRGAMKYSFDLETWTTVPLSPHQDFAVAPGDIVYRKDVPNLENKFICYAGQTNSGSVSQQKAFHSTDGISWSPLTLTGSYPGNSTWAGEYDEKIYYAGGRFNRFYNRESFKFSYDGEHWYQNAFIDNTGTMGQIVSNTWPLGWTVGGGKIVTTGQTRSVSSTSTYSFRVADDNLNVYQELTDDDLYSNLYWNEKKVNVKRSGRPGSYSTNTEYIYSRIQEFRERLGVVGYISDSLQETFALRDSDMNYFLLDSNGDSLYGTVEYNQGELWYQPSTNTLHVRDSDDWVALFQ